MEIIEKSSLYGSYYFNFFLKGANGFSKNAISLLRKYSELCN